MKKYYFNIIMMIFLLFSLTSCKKECEHIYDDCADIECNECGEKRDSNHSWVVADCDTPKTCNICGKTEGNALGHIPSDDDGDCSTEIKCDKCSEVLTEALEHNFNGKWQSDIAQHWQECQNDNCNVNSEKIDHTPSDDSDCTIICKCIICEETIVEAREKHEDANLDGTCDYCKYEFDYIYDESTMTYTVFTAEGLYQWENDNWKGLNLTLGKDIVMPTKLMFDIDGDGTNDSNWKGTRTSKVIDGNGYSISGIIMKSSINKDFNGFVTNLDEGGIIKNLRLINVNMSLIGINNGILVGANHGDIENCGVSGTLYVDGHYVSGIAAYNCGTIIACYNEANITATNGFVGGIVGQNWTEGTITACYNTGTITSNGDSVGGIVGSMYEGEIIGCYNNGKIIGIVCAGVVVGYADALANYELNYSSFNSENSEAVKDNNCLIVDGEVVTWTSVKEEINKVLESKEINWRYIENENNNSGISPLLIFKIS